MSSYGLTSHLCGTKVSIYNAWICCLFLFRVRITRYFFVSEIRVLFIYLFIKLVHHDCHNIRFTPMAHSSERKPAKRLPCPRNSCGPPLRSGFVFHAKGIPCCFKNFRGYPGAPRNEKLSVQVKRIQHRWMEVAGCGDGWKPVGLVLIVKRV